MAKVLIVDDALFMRTALRHMLEELGLTVIAEGANGKEGVELYDQFLPDVVTMDITMPMMSGIEALTEIITKYPDAKVVMVTALGQKKIIKQALEIGAMDFVTKPFKIDQLKQVFGSFTEK